VRQTAQIELFEVHASKPPGSFQMLEQFGG
jgi:hypothetical protein